MPGKSLAQQTSEEERASALAAGEITKQDKYQHAFCARAKDACFIGATNDALAELFEVDVSTIERWIREKPRFASAVYKGREGADAKVTRSLYSRAIGHKHKAQKIFNANGKPLVVDYVEEYPPETGAAIFWLTNRQKGKWRDTKAVEHSGQVNLAHLVESSLGELAKPVDAKVIEGASSFDGDEDPASKGK